MYFPPKRNDLTKSIRLAFKRLIIRNSYLNYINSQWIGTTYIWPINRKLNRNRFIVSVTWCVITTFSRAFLSEVYRFAGHSPPSTGQITNHIKYNLTYAANQWQKWNELDKKIFQSFMKKITKKNVFLWSLRKVGVSLSRTQWNNYVWEIHGSNRFLNVRSDREN